MWSMLIRNFTQQKQLCQTKIKLNQQSGINPKLSTFDAKFQSTRFNKIFHKDQFSFKKVVKEKALQYTLRSFHFVFVCIKMRERVNICLSGVDNFAVIKSKCILNVEYETPMQLKLCVLELIKCSAWNLLRSYLTFIENSIFWVCFIKKRKSCLLCRYVSEIHFVLVFLQSFKVPGVMLVKILVKFHFLRCSLSFNNLGSRFVQNI